MTAVVSDDNNQIASLSRDGVFVARQLLNTEEIAQVAKEHSSSGAFRHEAPPVGIPFVLHWTHVEGERELRTAMRDVPLLEHIVMRSNVAETARRIAAGRSVRLYETILFAKPPKISSTLHWHQDMSYFPIDAELLLTAWIPFSAVTRQTGALRYVLGSHKLGIRGLVDLFTNTPLPKEDRPLIPAEPEKGREVICCEVAPGDVLFHDGLTWHASGPNEVANSGDRLALSIRYLIGPARYRPHPANEGLSSRFTNVRLRPGDPLEGSSFPLLQEQ